MQFFRDVHERVFTINFTGFKSRVRYRSCPVVANDPGIFYIYAAKHDGHLKYHTVFSRISFDVDTSSEAVSFYYGVRISSFIKSDSIVIGGVFVFEEKDFRNDPDRA